MQYNNAECFPVNFRRNFHMMPERLSKRSATIDRLARSVAKIFWKNNPLRFAGNSTFQAFKLHFNCLYSDISCSKKCALPTIIKYNKMK